MRVKETESSDSTVSFLKWNVKEITKSEEGRNSEKQPEIRRNQTKNRERDLFVNVGAIDRAMTLD